MLHLLLTWRDGAIVRAPNPPTPAFGAVILPGVKAPRS